MRGSIELQVLPEERMRLAVGEGVLAGVDIVPEVLAGAVTAQAHG